MRSKARHTRRHSFGVTRLIQEKQDSLGRCNANKRGPKTEHVYTPEERRLLDTFGKYVKLPDGYTYETLKVMDQEHKFIKI